MIENQTTLRNAHLRTVALEMMNAARTAPKGRGVDNLEITMVTGDDIVTLSDKLLALSATAGRGFFARDGENILQSGAIVLIGTRNAVLNMNCGLCGFDTCDEKSTMSPKAPCAFNMHDLGLAIGSAVSIAADHRVDNRVMYSVGVAAMALGWMVGCHGVFAIPISAGAKNPFFDRAPLAPAAPLAK